MINGPKQPVAAINDGRGAGPPPVRVQPLGSSANIRAILETEGVDGLMKLPGIGKGLAAAIDEIAQTGQLSQFDRLRGASSPEILFQSLPGVGPGLAQAIHANLQIDTLEALEICAAGAATNVLRMPNLR